MEMISRAVELSKKTHKGQKYGEHDYFDFHIMGVIAELKKNFSLYFSDEDVRFWAFTEENANAVVAAAYLHDSLEDSENPEEIEKEIIDNFPEIVYNLVKGMTKVKGQSYSDYIFSILDSPFSAGIAAIKLADLSFNISQSEKRELNGYEKQRLQKYLLAHYILHPQGARKS